MKKLFDLLVERLDEDLASTAVMRKKEIPYQTYTPEEYGDPQEKIQDEEIEPGNFIPYVPAEESAEMDSLKGTRTEIPVIEKRIRIRLK